MRPLTNLQSVLIVVGGFICYFLADGYTFSVGVLYSYLLSAFSISSSSAAALPGLLYAVPQFTGIFLCPLLDTYGYSSGAAWGAILLSTSCIASAFAPNLYVLYFTLGVLASFGLQLTYSSAIMAVTETFKNDHLFGLAVGLTMCGSGIGSFSANPFVAWTLESWTWQELMLIESAILLNSLVSASCFHHLDAIRFRERSKLRLLVPLEEVKEEASSVEPESSALEQRSFANTKVDHCALGDSTCSMARTQYYPAPSRFRAVWSFLRYILCLPSRYRFKRDAFRTEGHCASASEESFRDDSCGEFWNALIVSLKQLVSVELWTNADFVVYIAANALTGMGVVIPWTFVYDHCLISLSRDGVLDPLNTGHVSWLPALIGLGSLFGQILFGLFTSRFCRCLSTRNPPEPSSATTIDNYFCSRFIRHVHSRSRCFMLFAVVLIWNGLATLLLALLPFGQLVTQVSPLVSFFRFPIGITMGAACFLTGISYGGLYVLYPQILMDLVGDQLWAAGLGVFLFTNGAMNLVGTTTTGRLFDTTGSYTPAFLLAACIPFVSLFLITVEQFVQYLRENR